MQLSCIYLPDTDNEQFACFQSIYCIAGHQEKLRYRRNYSHTSHFKDEIALIDGITMKGRIIVSASLQDKALKWLHL